MLGISSYMMTHKQIWTAIDQLAKLKGYSASGLAKKAGLDPTSFNRSKRKAPDGKPRWPSTESISKILLATDSTMGEFVGLIDEQDNSPAAAATVAASKELPMISDMEVASNSHFNPALSAAKFPLPVSSVPLSPQAWALHITTNPPSPAFQIGDVLIIDPEGPARAGDPFLIRRHSEDKLGIYRGQSAEPHVGDSLGRIMAAFYAYD